MEHLQYPIGRFQRPGSKEEVNFSEHLEHIRSLPALMRGAAAQLSPEAMDSPYRPEGWTRRQVIHHVADSHLNALLRFKWALTEDRPLIKTYDQNAFAAQADYQTNPELSLNFIEATHARWYVLMAKLQETDWDRGFTHPEQKRLVPLWEMIALYSWHGRHHLEHLRSGL